MGNEEGSQWPKQELEPMGKVAEAGRGVAGGREEPLPSRWSWEGQSVRKAIGQLVCPGDNRLLLSFIFPEVQDLAVVDMGSLDQSKQSSVQ